MRSKRLLLLGIALGVLFLAVPSVLGADNYAIILDASNSMNKPLGAATRLDAAKGALGELVDVIPQGTNVGFFVYGHRVSRLIEDKSCQDIQELFPIEPFQPAMAPEMRVEFDAVAARGLTPISSALIAAAEALEKETGSGAIVLLSDGEANCSGDPLAIAAQLAGYVPPIVVHVIGLDVDPAAREALTALARATGGEYYNVSEAESLFNALFAVISPTPTPTPTPAGPDIPAEYAALAKAWGITNVIRGTNGNDSLYGTPGNDLILGYGGNDLLVGLGGNDILIGGDGNDILEGGDGCDLLDGGTCNDVLLAGSGDDILLGGPGCDSLEGEAGNDCLDGGPGDDQLLGGPGLNKLFGGGGRDVLLEGQIVEAPCVVCPPACDRPTPCPIHSPLPCGPAMPPAQPSCQAAQPAWPPIPAPAPTCEPKPTCPMPTPPCPTQGGEKSVDEGCAIQLHGSVTDGDCNVVKILWTAERGRFDDPCALDPVYYAPMTDRCEGEDVQISLTAVDSCGAKGSDTFSLHVNNVNHAPIAEAGDDVVLDEGDSIRLTCAGTDPDGDAVTYSWTAAGGRGTFIERDLLHPVYTAPRTDLCEGEDIVLTLTVTDACGARSCDYLVVHVRNVNQAPTVELGPPVSMAEGTTLKFTPVVADPECEALAYWWSATKGSFDDPRAATPCYTAPMTDVCEGEDVVITLAVTDRCGLRTCDTVVVHVVNGNLPPVVKADP